MVMSGQPKDENGQNVENVERNIMAGAELEP